MKYSLLVLAPLLLAGCTTSFGGPPRNAAVDPAVEVTRFHAADRLDSVGKGSIAIIAVNAEQQGSSAYRAFSAALSRELAALGYTIVDDRLSAAQTARLAYRIIDPATDKDAFVSAGGPTGAFGRSVGVGLNIPFGGPRSDVLTYRLDVSLSDASSQKAIWEGRAIQQAQIGTRATDPEFFAPILARALFSGFPGESGKTITAP
jgi:hypothetical protein